MIIKWITWCARECTNCILKMSKNLGSCVHEIQSVWFVRDSGRLWLKEKQAKWHKGHGGLLRGCIIKISNGKKILGVCHCKKWMKLFLAGVQQSLYQSNWLIIFFFFTQFCKILEHFGDGIGGVCFLDHPVIYFIIVAGQKYFYQKFFSQKDFPEMCNKMYLPIWNFKVAIFFLIFRSWQFRFKWVSNRSIQLLAHDKSFFFLMNYFLQFTKTTD